MMLGIREFSNTAMKKTRQLVAYGRGRLTALGVSLAPDPHRLRSRRLQRRRRLAPPMLPHSGVFLRLLRSSLFPSVVSTGRQASIRGKNQHYKRLPPTALASPLLKLSLPLSILLLTVGDLLHILLLLLLLP